MSNTYNISVTYEIITDESAEQAAIDSVRGFERRALAALRPRAHEPEGGGNR